ncbi:hypothetical protein LQF12_01770 [Ruania suaedae]|uniref:hypothetical protein n=1 Tax=Ruania suaedae TaxID=2897774 RepID=UPI001E4133DF|nr:hypothetical protein [Ruania suaedae]UFU03365.1 hypothetical protein LQF12_01770 [Ruania suaedae]
MTQSPRGRTIMHVQGQPQEIIDRGTAIETLGGQMRESAAVLGSIKDRAADQQGQAIDALRESIGESHEVLAEAADLYEPVGPVIRSYGEALSDVKPKLDAHADECETLWSTFVALPPHGTYVAERGTGGLFQPEEGSPEADQQAEEDQAKRDAYEAWEAEAVAFDNDYDTWESAYDEAVQSIGEEMAGSIKDGFWDNWGDIIKGVLSWASLILGIAALIIGGPLLAALALIAGLAYLAVTVYEYSEGDASLLDVGLAALGVLPVGKLANLTKGLHLNKLGFKAMGKGMLGNFGKLKGLTTKPFGGGLYSTFKNKGTAAGLNQLFLGSPSFRSVHRTHKSMWEGSGRWLASMRSSTTVRNIAIVDYGLGVASNGLGHYGRVASATGVPLPFGLDIPDLPKAPGGVGVVL